MFIGNVTAGQISSLVWTATTRTLTADLMQEITDEGALGLVPATVLNSTAFGAYVQVVASTAHAVRAVEIWADAQATTAEVTIQIATGGAGSEVSKAQFRFVNATTGTNVGPFVRYLDPSLIPKGVRVAIAVAANVNNVAAFNVICAVTLIEDNS